VQLRPLSSRAINALYPETYRQLPSPIGWLIGSPSGHVLDLLLFLIAVFPTTGIALLVPATYVSHHPKGRSNGLINLSEKGRLVYVHNPLSSETPVPSLWLVVLPDTDARAQYLQGHSSAVVPSSAAI